MSDGAPRSIFDNVTMSARTHLGELMDETFKAKKALVRKLTALIELATTAEELSALNKSLADALVSANDLARVEQVMQTLGKLVTSMAQVRADKANIESVSALDRATGTKASVK